MHNLINDQSDHYNMLYCIVLAALKFALLLWFIKTMKYILVLKCFTSKKALREEESGDPERFGLTMCDPSLAREELTERMKGRDVIKCVYL